MQRGSPPLPENFGDFSSLKIRLQRENAKGKPAAGGKFWRFWFPKNSFTEGKMQRGSPPQAENFDDFGSLKIRLQRENAKRK